MIGNATAAELPASSDDQQQWVADAKCGAYPEAQRHRSDEYDQDRERSFGCS